jgi:transposase-like protein
MSLLRAKRRSKYSLASRRVAVRTHVAWYWRGLFMSVALGLGVALAWWIYDVGGMLAGLDRGASEQSIEQLRVRVRQLELENAQLHSEQVKINRHGQIDAEAQKNLERELKVLQGENATLKEELAFIRGMSSADRSGALNIQRFTVKKEVLGSYRFQVLLVQAGRTEQVFRGRLQLVVTAQGSRGNSVQLFPGNAAAEERFKISLKSYQSIEGDFQLAPGLVVKSVEARIFSDGSSQPKLSKTVNLS